MTVYRQSSCGIPLLKTYSHDRGRTWTKGAPMLASDSSGAQGIGTVRGQLLRMSSGVLVLAAGRPGLGLWLGNAAGTEWKVLNIGKEFNRLQKDPLQRFSEDFAAITNASGVIVNGTARCIGEGTGYVQLVEAEPGVLLLLFDRFAHSPMESGSCIAAPTPACAAAATESAVRSWCGTRRSSSAGASATERSGSEP